MRILLVGTGRMAFHLGHALRKAGLDPIGVAGRDPDHAQRLADQLGSRSYLLGGQLPPGDVRIIAVSDDAIAKVASLLPRAEVTTVHTSGARGWELLGDHAHRGVLWPVQSFPAGTPVDLSDVPLVIDAEDDHARAALRTIAGALGQRIVELPLPQRELVHIAAVFASNFPVQLLVQARHLLQREGLDPDLVVPLWSATARNAAQNAETALTGPARRGDLHTIAAHLQRLSGDADLRRAYQAISDLILSAHHPEKRRAAEGNTGGTG